MPHRLERRQSADPGYARRSHRQQRDAVRRSYMSVLKPGFDSGKYVNVAEPAGTWDPATAHDVRAAVHRAPQHQCRGRAQRRQRQCGNLLSQDPQGAAQAPDHRPGRDAHGPPNVLAGYQCGTVYKPIYLEAQAAALAASISPPASSRRQPGERQDGRFHHQGRCAFRAADAALGHRGQHGRYRGQGRFRRRQALRLAAPSRCSGARHCQLVRPAGRDRSSSPRRRRLPAREYRCVWRDRPPAAVAASSASARRNRPMLGQFLEPALAGRQHPGSTTRARIGTLRYRTGRGRRLRTGGRVVVGE